jgi:hypothetical protein
LQITSTAAITPDPLLPEKPQDLARELLSALSCKKAVDDSAESKYEGLAQEASTSLTSLVSSIS